MEWRTNKCILVSLGPGGMEKQKYYKWVILMWGNGIFQMMEDYVIVSLYFTPALKEKATASRMAKSRKTQTWKGKKMINGLFYHTSKNLKVKEQSKRNNKPPSNGRNSRKCMHFCPNLK